MLVAPMVFLRLLQPTRNQTNTNPKVGWITLHFTSLLALIPDSCRNQKDEIKQQCWLLNSTINMDWIGLVCWGGPHHLSKMVNLGIRPLGGTTKSSTPC